jgi:peptidoglycan/xylan/chitin deacetylase (PgdA/CDA1 family)
MFGRIGLASHRWSRKMVALAASLAVVFGATASALFVAAPASAAAATVVSLTFDNGWGNQMTAAADMQAAGLTGTFYVPSGWIGLAGYMSLANLDTLKADGDEIGGKTVNNPDLTALTQSGTASGTAEAEREVCEGRNVLLADGFDVTDFAYPFADFIPADETVAEECGFNSARSVGSLADTQVDGCTYPGCPYAETIPPADPYSIRTPDDAEVTTTVAQLEADVTNAVNNGGGLLAFSFHQICDTTTAGCDPTFSWSPTLFDQFVKWLASEQASGAISVETIQQVIGGAEQPAVTTYPSVPAAPVGTQALTNPNLSDGLTITGSPTQVSSTATTPVTYSVTVSEGATPPTGSVIVSDGNGNSCSITSLTAGSGSCVIDEPAAATPYTVTATYLGDANYPATLPTLTGSVNETVAPAAAALPSSAPACWTPESYGSNTPSFSWNPSGGVNGGGAETINLSNVEGAPNEDANLVTTFDLGQCAPTATVGGSYQLSVYYESSVPVYFNVFGRASDGTWSYWTGSPTFPAASTWTLATWLTPAVPSTISALSYGMTIDQDGSLSTSDNSLIDIGTEATPVITTSPVNQSVTAGQDATFSAAASGNPVPSVQWQVSTDGGTTWTPLSGATSDTLVVSATTPTQTGNEYKAIFTNTLGSATAGPATLTVTPIAQTISFTAPPLCQPSVRRFALTNQ